MAIPEGNVIKRDLTDYLKTPTNKVLNDPLRAIIYSVSIKVFALFVSLVSPLTAGIIVGFSLFQIDRVGIQNFDQFKERIVTQIDFNRIIQAIFQANQPPPANPQRAATD
ncbi:MAG: hypothetical protein K1060chlam5_00963 [Candidatus Anoxychlamydiales bacterium]|nr:hypothetical protein [Candidatus Anoxychlamydiales bacterium]